MHAEMPEKHESRLMIIADDSITCRAMTIAAHRYARTKMCKAANSKEFEVSETPDSRVWDSLGSAGRPSALKTKCNDKRAWQMTLKRHGM